MYQCSIDKPEHPQRYNILESLLDVIFHDIALFGAFYLFLPFILSSYFKSNTLYLKVGDGGGGDEIGLPQPGEEDGFADASDVGRFG